MSFLKRHLRRVIAIVMLLGVAGSYFAYYRHLYPYGQSHCCDKQLYSVLAMYAHAHDGDFPSGEATPEASLSLIQGTDGHDCAYLLCGKSGSAAVVKNILDDGKLLGPDTCGWNYVEGLRSNDDSRLALFWDKEGLAHNGMRLDAGGHIVMFVDGFTEYIPAAEWDQFLAEQRLLFAKRKNGRERKDAAIEQKQAELRD